MKDFRGGIQCVFFVSYCLVVNFIQLVKTSCFVDMYIFFFFLHSFMVEVSPLSTKMLLV